MATSLERTELLVEGMDCADCVAHVETAVGRLSGVSSVRVYLASEKAIVTYDPSQVDLGAVKGAIEGVGYKVRGAPEEKPRSTNFSHLLGGLFLGVVALVILVGMVGERLGLIEGILERIPAPISIIAVLVGGYPIFRNVALALKVRSVTPHALMTIGILGALAIGEYATAAVIVFFMRFADYLEELTTRRSRQAIKELTKVAPQKARVEREDSEVELGLEEVRLGDVVVVRPGERIPVDGKVIAGAASVNQAPLTGESLPVGKKPGDEAYAATMCELGFLRIETSAVGPDTTFGHVIRLVEEAEGAKAPVQRFADRFTAYYIPVVLTIAALTFGLGGNPVAAVSVLVVSCACAVALATPVAVLASVGRAARQGILIKGGLSLELLARVDTVVMDKTGTLTLGEPRVSSVIGLNGTSDEEVLRLAAAAERHSEHPLAAAVLREARERGIEAPSPDSFSTLPGQGVAASWNGASIALGNLGLMQETGVDLPAQAQELAVALEGQGKTVLFLAQPPELLGMVAASDVLRPEVGEALGELRRLGVRRLIMLTGDNASAAKTLAHQLGVEYRAGMLPQDKLTFIRKLQAQGRVVAMVGDGINDAPALAQADVGIAMGVAGTDVAIEAADVALMREDWRLVPQAIRVGRRTFSTIKQNLAFAGLYNVTGIGLAALGVLAPVVAAAAQSLPDVVIMLNSSRLLRR